MWRKIWRINNNGNGRNNVAIIMAIVARSISWRRKAYQANTVSAGANNGGSIIS